MVDFKLNLEADRKGPPDEWELGALAFSRGEPFDPLQSLAWQGGWDDTAENEDWWYNHGQYIDEDYDTRI